jgi:putative transposase
MKMFKYIAKWKKLHIIAWHIGEEYIHLQISIPPKYSVSYITQVLKGKTSMWIKKKTKKLPDGSLWARGYFVTTTGLNEHQVRNYILNQSHHQIELVQQKFHWFKKS